MVNKQQAPPLMLTNPDSSHASCRCWTEHISVLNAWDALWQHFSYSNNNSNISDLFASLPYWRQSEASVAMWQGVTKIVHCIWGITHQCVRVCVRACMLDCTKMSTIILYLVSCWWGGKMLSLCCLFKIQPLEPNLIYTSGACINYTWRKCVCLHLYHIYQRNEVLGQLSVVKYRGPGKANTNIVKPDARQLIGDSGFSQHCPSLNEDNRLLILLHRRMT